MLIPIQINNMDYARFMPVWKNFMMKCTPLSKAIKISIPIISLRARLVRNHPIMMIEITGTV